MALVAEQKKPNIILCMADDLGWGDVGFNGGKEIKTPALDKIAENGVVFNRFYSSSPVCSPTRASCLTGRHPYRTGIFFANVGILRQEEITIAEVLKKEGYRTGHFGKWHLGTFSKTEKDANRGGKKHPELFNPPTLHGFDEYFSTESKVPTWDPMIVPEKFNKPENRHFGWRYDDGSRAFKNYGTAYWKTGEVKETENLKGDDSRVIMDRALDFMTKSAKKDEPFFTVIWFHAPHLPCVAGPKYAAMYKDKSFEMQQYAGCITALDEQMGRLNQHLKKLGIAKDTMVCFTSDNGPEQRTPGTTGGLKSRKRSLNEGGVRVPGLISWPGMIKKGFKTDAIGVTSDYLPTILDILNISEFAHELDGESLLPVLQGKVKPRQKAVNFASAGQFAASTKDYKIYSKKKKIELYEISKDRAEKNDVASQHPELVNSYKKQFDSWFESCRESFEGHEFDLDPEKTLKQKWRK